ncbi:MFS transporter [Paraburkholderia tropica]|uniref:MFS transporter n=1 Tax=Paraburkholderia tropica TaxID=92647 RepID=UPI002AB09291|nr:MFS transporter [Paraburkholderia tropica]
MAHELRDAAIVGREVASTHFSRRDARLVILAIGVVLLDGLAFSIMNYLAPAITRDWLLAPTTLGSTFGVAMAGWAIGSALGGVAGDRFGRRATVAVLLAIFGLLTCATASAASVPLLLMLRFATGVAAGGTTPIVLALLSVHGTQRWRPAMITAAIVAVPLGGAIAGLLSALFLADAGWRVLFILSGVPAILFAPLLFRLLAPEAGSATHSSVDPGHPRALFAQGYRANTLSLWLMGVMNMFLFGFLISWLPTLFTLAGLDARSASLYASLFELSGVAGCAIVGTMALRWEPARMLLVIFPLGGVAAALIGSTIHVGSALLLCLIVAGFCTNGAAMGGNYLATILYPPSVRSIGIGWAMAIGRIGAIIGPVAGGVLVGWHVPPALLFTLFAMTAFVAALASWYLARCNRRLRSCA